MIVNIAAFIFMLVILVFVHELGHFVVALRMGIRVEEFGIGYPPRALTLLERNGVKYTLNWLPLGGFVRFGGEGDNALYGVGSLAQAPPWRKIPVMLAGPLMNLFLAMVILAGLFAAYGEPTGNQRLSEVFSGSPAAAAGLRPDDVLVSHNNQPVRARGSITAIASASVGQPIPAVVKRDGQLVTVQVTPGPWTKPDGTAMPAGLGISYGPEQQPTTIFRAAWLGVVSSLDALRQMLGFFGSLIGGLFTGAPQPEGGGLAGPIGIARVTGEVIERGGISGFWNLMALLSLNLFLLNLLPIPALDGSHILFALIEWVRGGRKVPPEKEALVHAIGFATLMVLMLVVSISDIVNAVNGRSVLGGG